MDLRSGHPFPLLKNGLPCVFPSLGFAERCDVAVVGAGISGALVADELAREGLDVVVLDRREAAHGSTAASTSLLQYEIDVPLVELIPLVGEAHAFRIYQLGIEALDKLEDLTAQFGGSCSFVRRPSLYFASRKSHAPSLADEYRLRRRAGIELDLLTRDQMRERFPFPSETALYSRHAGEMDAYRLTHCLLRRAQSNGARVYDRTEMLACKRAPRGFRLSTDREYEVAAKRVVFCTGYESQPLIPKEKTGQLHSTYVIASEPVEDLSGWHERCLIWETARPYHYLRTTDDRRIYIGGFDEPFTSAAKRDAVIPQRARALERKFRKMFPAIAFERYCAWAGTFGVTRDGIAYIGEPPSFPETFFVLGYGGNGITYSVMAAQLAKDFILNRKNPDAPIFRFRR